MESIAPGIWKITINETENLTSVKIRPNDIRTESLNKLEKICGIPFDASLIKYKNMTRGLCIEIPLKADEKIYGFGLQLKSFNQTGKKKYLRPNADPVADNGDSHAPVPFFVSTKGYGILVDTFRYVSFYCGSSIKTGKPEDDSKMIQNTIAGSTDELYSAGDIKQDGVMIIDVPHVKGVDIYIFGGPDMKSAVQRYNLFSGGGCLPPMWGLGVLYRGYAKADKKEIIKLAESFREDHMPCDIMGLEPGWQSHSYSCSYAWDKERFDKPEEIIDRLTEMNFNINLWEHAFVHPTSPLYEDLKEHSCDYEVFGGLTPDFLVDEAKNIFSGYHQKELIEKGITGFKLDECDSSDYTGSWSFPNCAEFPSGMDGEQMHSAFGLLYQRTVLDAFGTANPRTYGQVRSSHALAAPMPFVLYSDLYDHADFIKGIVNVGFSGLLWTPEVRQCSSVEDLIRRIQTVVFSPQVCINAWMIPHPPWKQYDYDKNLKGEFLEDYRQVEKACIDIFEWRMRLIPYLYSSFYTYHKDGIPPFRALVMDYPTDSTTYDMDDEYMMGDSMLVAPVIAGQKSRKVYLPEGIWYCFWTNRKYDGGKTYEIEADDAGIPVFVMDNAIIPLARPLEYVSKDTCFEIDVKCYGNDCKPFELFEDDGITHAFQTGCYNTVRLTRTGDDGDKAERHGNYPAKRYEIKTWECIN